MPPKDKYTDPELRDEVKEEIHQGDRGGAPGQWSARKAQMMASEYKKRGGGYTTDKKDKDASQKHLDTWTEEEWQTKEGSGHAKQDDGTEKRYLPKKAWEQMSEQEKEETDDKKQQGSKDGKQYVENTSKAKSARKNASKAEADNEKELENGQPQNCSQHWERGVQLKDGQKEYKEFKQNEDKLQDEADEAEDDQEGEPDDKDAQDQRESRKRGRGANQNGANKKQKQSDGKEDTPGTAGDKNRVPKEGQTVQWKTIQGLVDGEVVEVVYEEKTVEGKSVKGSKEDPRVVLRSGASGKIAVHKPEAVYFD